jgi:hypothetical protein
MFLIQTTISRGCVEAKMTDPPNKAKIIDLRMGLGSSKFWGEFHRRVAVDAIIACLVCPKGRRRRAGIYLRLLDGDLGDLRKIAGESPQLAARCKAIDQDIGSNRRLTTFKQSPGAYRRKLFGDLTRLRCDAVFLPGSPPANSMLAKRQKTGHELKNIVTAGFILLTMVWAAQHSPSQEFGPAAAKDFPYTYGEALGLGSLIKTNRSGLDEAWRKKRPVAHLAAALFLFLETLETARFGKSEQVQWRDGIVDYLEHAQWLAEFLVKVRTRRMTALRFRSDLLALPAEIEVNGRKPDLAVGRPAAFDEAFSQWLKEAKSQGRRHRNIVIHADRAG